MFICVGCAELCDDESYISGLCWGCYEEVLEGRVGVEEPDVSEDG
jgi:hypothetical protein